MKVLFGPAGLGSSALNGLDICKQLGLKAAEIEFTYGVRMDNKTAKAIGKKAEELNIALSVHAPFYINLASKDKEKLIASKQRILRSCERAHFLKAKYVVFHAGFYQGRDKDDIYDMIKHHIQDIQDQLEDNNINTNLAPEVTGKESQFGNLDELLKLRKETKCELCVDFAHIFARNIGKINYDEVFKKLKPVKHIHSHFSGIHYTQKGERNHELITKQFFLPFAKAIKKHKPDITIINESPDPVGDAVKIKDWFG